MAIDIKDLRRGNIVEHQTINAEVFDIFGKSIRLSFFAQKNEPVPADNHVEAINIYPVTLTAEWLMKFGYYSDTEFPGTDVETVPFYTNGSPLILNYYDFSPSWQGIQMDLDFKLEFVHQFQNLYHSLTGKDIILR